MARDLIARRRASVVRLRDERTIEETVLRESRLLTADFTLTHITGYVQARSEWLTEMDAGQFRYHAVEQQGEPLIQVAGGSATLTHRIITDATVYGSRNRWRLAFVQTFVRGDGAWLASKSVATTW